MAKCPRCQRMFASETGYCPNCGYQPGGQFSPGNDQTRSAEENYPYLPVPPVGSGQSFSSPVPPLAAGAPFGSGNHPQSWQQPVYPGINPGQNQSAANYYSPQPGGEIPGGGREPRENRKKQVILSILIGVVVAVALVSGIAYVLSDKNKPKVTVASSSISKTTTATKTPTPEITRVELPGPGAWLWRGGAMITGVSNQGEQENPQYSFKVWTPKLKDKTVDCTFSPVQNGEKITSQDISVTATYGDDPTVFVVYTVLNKAVGTSPETVHLYAQQIDLPSCEAKSRIDLQTEPDNVVNDRQDYSFKIVGKSEKSVVVAKTWSSEYKKPEALFTTVQKHVQVMSLTGGQTKATSLQELAADESKFAISTSVTNDIYMIATDKRRFYSIDSNKVMFEMPIRIDVGNSSCDRPVGDLGVLNLFRLSSNLYLFSCKTGGGNDHSLPKVFLVDNTGKLTPLIGLLKVSGDHPDFRTVALEQLKDGSVLITCSGTSQIFHLGIDGKVSEILDSAQWERLLHSAGSHFGVTNYLTNQFYVQTTDEILTMDLTGKSGRKLEVEPKVTSTNVDVTKVNWIAWEPTESSSNLGAVLTTGALPNESETNQ